MQTKLRKIGNSYGILLPHDLLELLNLKEGDQINLTTENQTINLTLNKKEVLP
jgi:putative addiction module antidote